ncbi:MAG: hypothetical protein ACRDY4_16685 [Acidimicrobiia bacterium]
MADLHGRAQFGAAAGRWSPVIRRLALFVAALVVAGACASAPESGDGEPAPDAAVSTDEARGDRCDPAGEPAQPSGPGADAVTLQQGNGESPAVEAVVYPRPDYDGDPWSQWGQGLVLADGRFVSGIGDHLGRNGNSYFFVYDPERGRITRFTDVLSQVEHEDGEWGYGKIHGQIVAGACGEAYVGTYWGTDQGIEFGRSYRGDLLLRLDTATLELDALGAPLSEHGIPSLAGPGPEDLVYGEAVVPAPEETAGSKQGAFFAYDTAAGEVAFRADDERLNGFRNIIVTDDGTAYVSAVGSRLLVYEPGAQELRMHPEPLPGGFLRASTRPAPDGTVYGVTERPANLFALRPDGAIDDLGAAEGYTASLALHPDGDRFFYVPGAHGDSAELGGTPLIAVDTETGEHTTVVELNELAEQELGLTLGGSYSVAVDPSGDRVYVSLNAGADRTEPWGEVVLVVVDLP